MMIYGSLSDEKLLALLKQNDYMAFDQIFERYYNIMVNNGYNKFRDREQAKDFTQDVLSKLWRDRETQEIKTTLLIFLLTSVRNLFFNKFENEKVHDKYIGHLLAFANKDCFETDGTIRTRQLTEQIEKEILSLPRKMREVFELSRKGYLSHQEIARIKCIEVSTVNSHISTAIGILKEKLANFFTLFL